VYGMKAWMCARRVSAFWTYASRATVVFHETPQAPRLPKGLGVVFCRYRGAERMVNNICPRRGAVPDICSLLVSGLVRAVTHDCALVARSRPGLFRVALNSQAWAATYSHFSFLWPQRTPPVFFRINLEWL
jgi:hypothetical protein